MSHVVAIDSATRAVFSKCDQIAAIDSPVLITGETGTGKEIVARTIHQRSRRSAQPFIPVNCGAFPEALIETELFGHRKGAFTGAVSDKRGLISEADGGTLFLDEIGDMPLSVQARLLRFLDSGEVRAVGSTALRYVHVRVIAATNRVLEIEIANGRFRPDLYYRVAALKVDVPPLRTRPADIPVLAHNQLTKVAADIGKVISGLAPECLPLLLKYNWPGNIRELQRVINDVVLNATSEVISADTLSASLFSRLEHGANMKPLSTQSQEFVAATMTRAQAAAAMGISRTTLWRRSKNVSRHET